MSTATISRTVTRTEDFVVISGLTFQEACKQAKELVIGLTFLPATENGKKRYINRNGNDIQVPVKFWDELNPPSVEEEDVEETLPPIDLMSMKKPQLLALADQRKVKVNRRMTVAQLRTALQ